MQFAMLPIENLDPSEMTWFANTALGMMEQGAGWDGKQGGKGGRKGRKGRSVACQVEFGGHVVELVVGHVEQIDELGDRQTLQSTCRSTFTVRTRQSYTKRISPKCVSLCSRYMRWRRSASSLSAVFACICKVTRIFSQGSTFSRCGSNYRRLRQGNLGLQKVLVFGHLNEWTGGQRKSHFELFMIIVMGNVRA